MREAILVLGMHRSGTSAMAGMMAKLGAVSPHSLMAGDERNARGYFESVLFWQFHDRLLKLGGSSWYDWRAFDMARLASSVPDLQADAERLLREEFGDAPLFVLKDPRICRFVPFWLSTFGKLEIAPRVVIPFRPPLEVAHSLHKREGCSQEKGLLMWLRHTLDAERATRHVPRCCVSMDDLIEDWRRCARQISRYAGITWPQFDDEAEAEIDKFLSRDLKHHDVANVEVGPARSWVVRAYDALLILAKNPNSKLAQATLDEISESFEQAIALIGAECADLEVHAKRVEANAMAIAAERDALRQGRSDGAKVVLDLRPQPRPPAEAANVDRLLELSGETKQVRRNLLKLRDQLADG